MLSGEAEVIRVRVLVAFEDTYRAYGDAIVRAIRSTYPRLEVLAVADLRELEAEVALFDPHLVITSRSSHPASLASRRGRLSRVKLSCRSKPAVASLYGRAASGVAKPLSRGVARCRRGHRVDASGGTRPRNWRRRMLIRLVALEPC
jgi:hypothetical protein